MLLSIPANPANFPNNPVKAAATASPEPSSVPSEPPTAPVRERAFGMLGQPRAAASRSSGSYNAGSGDNPSGTLRDRPQQQSQPSQSSQSGYYPGRASQPDQPEQPGSQDRSSGPSSPPESTSQPSHPDNPGDAANANPPSNPRWAGNPGSFRRSSPVNVPGSDRRQPPQSQGLPPSRHQLEQQSRRRPGRRRAAQTASSTVPTTPAINFGILSAEANTTRVELTQYSWWKGENPPPAHLQTAKQLLRRGQMGLQACGVIYANRATKIYLFNPRDSQAVVGQARFARLQQRAKRLAQRWAHDLLQRQDWVVLDTETTGIKDPQPVQIAAIDPAGTVLLNTLVRPHKPIEAKATQTHGITNADVQAPGVPQLSAVYADLLNQLAGKAVVAYNARFDRKVIENACPNPDALAIREWLDVLPPYAAACGEWCPYRLTWKWPKLGGNHDALGDCQQTLQIIQAMAGVLGSEG